MDITKVTEAIAIIDGLIAEVAAVRDKIDEKGGCAIPPPAEAGGFLARFL